MAMNDGIGHMPLDRRGDALTVAGCIEPGAVTRDDLMAYVDGEAAPHVAEHVRRCAACAAELRALAGAQRSLQRALHRFECPAPPVLGEYALALLPQLEQRLVAAHVVDCPRCTEEVQTLRTFLSVEPQSVPSAFERLKRVVATLLTPPGSAAIFAEFRGGVATTAPLAYRSEDVTVTVSVQPDDGGARRWALHGLVVRDGPSLFPAQTRLIAPDGTTRESPLDDLGNFLYEGLPPGVYQLEVDLPEHVLVAENVAIGGG
ncbi:MAG TPA: hypothetical protein VFX49_15330 [Chloroflexota bacterium]|nr:hypothetical protein [Chloroflexota bacterium]